MSSEEVLWVEKYRPSRIDDIIDQDHVKARVKEMLANGNIPHLLFFGPPGTGKTTMALAIARELYGDAWRENVLELNASDERGIAMIREKVKEFAKTMPTVKAPFRLIILDEADNMTPDAQQALRRIMEMYTTSVRFILLANYPSGIIEPIQSRCSLFRFSPLPKDAVLGRLREIASKEGVKVTDDALEAIWDVSQGDMRKAINTLQAAASLGGVVDEEVVYKALGKVSPTKVRTIVTEAVVGDFGKAVREVMSLIRDEGADPLDIIKIIHREVVSAASQLKVPEELKPKAVYIVSEHHYRLLRGSSGELQVYGLLARIRRLLREGYK
ncbi:replication factor C small subunit [Vulcanisaeta distributa]|uniref:Replication factor C small subunit n=1 Tax=Vulcanisaeta distributa (strain DSM 14429 / JCM 11212 / NBRC 100878 / IC-017) TaxID=572478 RepID=E1QPB2_VULDI|nr:replication factor C small subunit [Vulcanisaeta distributa]ADN50283.1 Replication factor C [Vulcanisaeta distributa DSM 14429]